jgi:hypothetical protein
LGAKLGVASEREAAAEEVTVRRAAVAEAEEWVAAERQEADWWR